MGRLFEPHIHMYMCALCLSHTRARAHTRTHTLGPAVNFWYEQNLLACHRFVSSVIYGHGGDNSTEGQAHAFVVLGACAP